jgi:hypothetical protein
MTLYAKAYGKIYTTQLTLNIEKEVWRLSKFTRAMAIINFFDAQPTYHIIAYF